MRYALAVLKDRRFMLTSGPPSRSYKPSTLKTFSPPALVPAVLEQAGHGRVIEIYEVLDDETGALRPLPPEELDRIIADVMAARPEAGRSFSVNGVTTGWLNPRHATALIAQNDALHELLDKERALRLDNVWERSQKLLPSDEVLKLRGLRDGLLQRIELLEDQLASVTEDRELSEERARVANSQLEMVLNAATQALTELLLVPAPTAVAAAGFRLAGAKNLLRGLDVTGVSKKVPALAAAWAEAMAGTDPVTGQPVDEEGA